ncbi:magnesium chelatase subunit D [Croceicoccus sp. BE223]|uniref:magnesium chelatase subunit D n=1 Tax=Croceicoccus sp. BE223 TaxID=2817716 RepID=UPI0028609E21|nr:magnesium chelatase subunit D [Croceicoccus sp. BE223]MDR7101591.1 magnesium chelatase subunit D [Croceicoccus sp. BE223]
MIPPDDGTRRFADAALALDLLAIAPRQLGGIGLRGAGPARDALVDHLRDAGALRRLPAHVDDERLLGGIDIPSSLSAGRTVRQAGLLDEVRGGTLLVPMAERLAPAIAGRLAQAIDTGADFAIVLLDDGATAEEGPPPALAERVAFLCDLAGAPVGPVGSAPARTAFDKVEAGDGGALSTLAATALTLGIDSVRALLFALACARAHAARQGRATLSEEDLQAAARLVLAPRATRLPASDDAEPQERDQNRDDASARDDPGDTDAQGDDRPPDDRVLEAALAAIPPDLLARLAEGAGRRNARGSGGGRKAKSALRGKPLGARPGLPRGGARLALIDTLRAAVPWQPLRLREVPELDARRLLIRKSDLRIRRFEDRASAVTVFCVDASGSAAMARLAEAKGAVELMLAQAYVTRSEVALIAFRGRDAELLLPPTRSLTRARRALAEMPGGGGTPLATGLSAGRRLAEGIAARGSTPFLVFLTDGSANIAADGSPGRARARTDAEAAARSIAAARLAALVIDIAPRPRTEAEAVARLMAARYLPLPMADAATLRRAVDAARPSLQPA